MDNGNQPRRVADFGMGCGSASAAAVQLFPSVEWIHGIEPSLAMRDCSHKLLEVSCQSRITYSDTLSTTGSGSFNLALLCYTATNLPNIILTLSAAAMLFDKLQPNGILVMVKPGMPDGFNSIRAVQNMLLDCCPPEDDPNKRSAPFLSIYKTLLGT